MRTTAAAAGPPPTGGRAHVLRAGRERPLAAGERRNGQLSTNLRRARCSAAADSHVFDSSRSHSVRLSRARTKIRKKINNIKYDLKFLSRRHTFVAVVRNACACVCESVLVVVRCDRTRPKNRDIIFLVSARVSRRLFAPFSFVPYYAVFVISA